MDAGEKIQELLSDGRDLTALLMATIHMYPWKKETSRGVSMSKLEEFRAKARELAQSSNFYGWAPLEFELRFEDGYSDSREWLYLPSTRDELDRICQDARKRREAA